MRVLIWWHEKMAIKYSNKMYPMRKDYYTYKLFEVKFNYHMSMRKWYQDMNDIKRQFYDDTKGERYEY